MSTAAAIIIGDEILSGKVRDTNSGELIELLCDLGVRLERLVTVRDDPDVIAGEVRNCAENHDYVFTSGGVGPTHDDRTMEGVARAYGCRVVHHPELESIIRTHWGERLNDAALKLADVPEGASLLASDDGLLPLVVFRNIYILPGVPQMFRAKLHRLRDRLAGTRQVLHNIYLSTDESSIAAALSEVDAAHPGVSIGSYPRVDDSNHRVRVTVEGSDAAEVELALDRLLELLPPQRVIRVERGPGADSGGL